MPPITPIHPVQAKDGRSYRRLAPAVQELMGGKVRGRIGDAEAKLAREAEWEASLAGGRSVRETFGLPS
jgi:hypothetical protein